jgi:tungstate transport system ATP-binding protein
MSTPVIELKSVGVSFGEVTALRACNLRVVPGERLALVGANGSGKSTLLRTVNGLLRPNEGHCIIDAAVRQAMVFQKPYMLRASVLNNVALGLWLRGVKWSESRMQARQALKRVRLHELADRNAKTLSGGQQQRLALARAWALEPGVLLLDEPTASLDPSSKREVEQLMAEFADSGMTLVFSSHNLGQVKRLASRVIYLEHGQVVADLSVQNFFKSPLPPAAELFVKGERI